MTGGWGKIDPEELDIFFTWLEQEYKPVFKTKAIAANNKGAINE